LSNPDEIGFNLTVLELVESRCRSKINLTIIYPHSAMWLDIMTIYIYSTFVATVPSE